MIAERLAEWAAVYEPDAGDLALAERALLDTTAVAAAAQERGHWRHLGPEGRYAARAHVLDFDDLHLPSTTHVSAVCVPAARSARAYLAGAGVMARLGTALGWEHYARGWHATCTAGAPAAAVAEGVNLGLDAPALATAMALAVPAAGGVQRAFGTDAKALQVGFAVDAGVRAARLAADGATADPAALDAWLALLGGDPSRAGFDGPAVPGGLAIKLFPCCYALQRPMLAALGLADDGGPITVRTPESALQPLIHRSPRTGLEAKFSLEHGIAAALAFEWPSFEAFDDAAAAAPEIDAIRRRVRVEATPGGDGLLAGSVVVETGGRRAEIATVDLTSGHLQAKLAACGGPADPSWTVVP